MIRKSLETRDWLHTMEPHNVRSVMKRMVEEVTMIDKQVGLLFEEGVKKSEGSGKLLFELCLLVVGIDPHFCRNKPDLHLQLHQRKGWVSILIQVGAS